MTILDEMLQYGFTQQDVDVLEPFLSKWKTAKQSQRTPLAHKAYRKIQALDRTMSKATMKEKKKGIYYFFLKYGRTRKAQERFHYIKRWTYRMIVAEKHRDSIHQKAQKLSGNAPPGSQAFLSNYQTALSKVVESLGEEEVEEAKEIAKDWNSRGPPTEFKKKLAHTHSTRYVQEFCKQMKKGCGMDCLVLSFYQDEEDNIVVKFHEFMQEMGGKSFIKSNPGWEEAPILEALAQHAELMYPKNSGTQTDASRRTTQKPLVQLETDDDGYPELPDDWQVLKLAAKKELIRAVMTLAYRAATGRRNATVPWKELNEDLQNFITDEYWPAGCRVSDPSHLQSADVERLLTVWDDRQTARQPAFRFEQVKDLEGNFMPPGMGIGVVNKGKKRVVDSEDSNDDKRRQKPAAKAGKRKRKAPATPPSEGEEFDFAGITSSDESTAEVNPKSLKIGPPGKRAKLATGQKKQFTGPKPMVKEAVKDARETTSLRVSREGQAGTSESGDNVTLPATSKAQGKSVLRPYVEIVTPRKHSVKAGGAKEQGRRPVTGSKGEYQATGKATRSKGRK